MSREDFLWDFTLKGEKMLGKCEENPKRLIKSSGKVITEESNLS